MSFRTKHVFIPFTIFGLSCLIACEDEATPINFLEGFHQISSIEHFSSDKSEGVEIFNYKDSLLNQVDDQRSYAKYKEFIYDNEDRLQEILTYQTDDNTLLSRDSIAYHKNQRIEKIYKFNINVSTEVELSSIEELFYDRNGYLSEKVTGYDFDIEYKSVERYRWKNNNIVQVDHLDGKLNLRYEYFYEYDHKFNYQLNNPHFIIYTYTWSKNNVIKFSAKDYTGLLDLACNPCHTNYFYNSSGLPTDVIYDWGRALKITY